MTASSTPSLVLVVGATGRQGRSVVGALQQLSSPPKIRALTRNTSSAAAQKLADQGVEVVKGSLSDKASLVAALTGVNAAYLMTSEAPGKGELPEDAHGLLFLQAALETSLPFLVFSSAADVSPTCGVPHFETKARIEAAIKGSGIAHAILRPFMFYDNFPRQSGVASWAALGLLDIPLQGKKQQMVTIEDIGYFAAQALSDSADYAGRTITLAGDDLSMEDIRQVYQRVEGRSVGKGWFPSWIVYLFPAKVRALMRWMEERGSEVDIERLRKEHRGLKTFEQWLREGKKEE
ncbi:hypothetical protein JCM6882_007418 [Rhodosporidiobolus microsporus]